MLPKINRLKKQKDFDRVFKEGRGERSGFLLLKFAKNQREVSRFGFVVGLKISNKAVVRNRIKRRLRNIIRKKLPEIKPGFDCVLVALKGIETKDSKEINSTAERILQKSKLTN